MHECSPRLSRRSILRASAAGTAGLVAANLLRPETAGASVRGLITASDMPKGTQLVLLGTAGGPPADYVRTGISSALVVEGKTYVIDAGRSSVTQYLNAGLLFSSLTGMVITHLHADHIADYYNYFLLGGSVTNDSNDNLAGPVWVYGPGPAGGLPPAKVPPVRTIHPSDPTPGITSLSDYLTDGYAYSHNIFIRETAIRDVRTLLDVHDIHLPHGTGASALGDTAPPMQPFLVTEDDRVRITAILVPHGPVFPAYAYRFDTDAGSVVFSGDTRVSDNVIRLAQGADILVHEVIDIDFYESIGVPAPLLEHFKVAHTPDNEVGGIAQAAGVGTLVLSHLVPSNPIWVSDAQYRKRAKIGYDGHVIVGNDLDRIKLGARRS